MIWKEAADSAYMYNEIPGSVRPINEMPFAKFANAAFCINEKRQISIKIDLLQTLAQILIEF